MLLMSPYILQLMSGLGGRMRPVFNVTISNVPGPQRTLYYEGAKLESHVPGVPDRTRRCVEHHLP